MKRLFIILISLFGCFIMEAHEKDSVTVNLGVDIVDQYIWRGQHLGHVSMQPTLGVGFKGLSLSTWGSMGISNWNDTKELDLTLDYTFKGLNVGLTDYWLSTGASPKKVGRFMPLVPIRVVSRPSNFVRTRRMPTNLGQLPMQRSM